MVTKVQKMLNLNRTADPFETWHKNRSSLRDHPSVWRWWAYHHQK